MHAVEEEVACIPADLHGEILYRLPSNDLLNFKRVCRDWERLISSPEFIKKHLERSNCNEPRILIPFGGETEVLDCANIDITKKISLQYGGVLRLGSCDGLVLYYDYKVNEIGALNPSTGECEVRKLSPPLQQDIEIEDFICTWFGRHPSTGEYVLVLAYELEIGLGLGLEETRHLVFKVYSLSHDSLLSSSTKEIDSNTASFHSFQEIGTFSHGILHCTSNFYLDSVSPKTDIITYDFQTNEIGRVGPPTQFCPMLGVVDGCLCVICKGEEDNLFEMWVMKDKESWSKYANIEGYGYAEILCPLAFCQNGDVILYDYRWKVTRYSFRDIQSTLLKDSRTCHLSCWRVYVACIDSLVSPMVLWSDEFGTEDPVRASK